MSKHPVPNYKRILILPAVSVLLFLPAVIKGIPSGNDLPHHYRTAVSFYEEVHAGSLYPGWNGQSTGGYGDVTFRFYPPGTYYLLSVTRSLIGGWYYGSLLAFVLLSTLGGLGVYYWARGFLSSDLSMWAGIFYIIAPFHVNEIYQAFLLPEYAGSALLPFCFAFTRRICDKGRMRDVAGLSAFYGLLLLTHLPLAVIGSVALFTYAMLTIHRARILRTLLQLSIAAALGLAASARYWMTMISEIHWLKGDNSPWFDYRYNFLFWKSVEGSTSWWANILGAITMLFFLPGLLYLCKKSAKQPFSDSRRIAILVLFSFVMATPISKPVWDILPGLKEVEFPWRWLVVTSLSGSLVLASSIPFWLEKRQGQARPLALLAAACLLIPCAVTVFQTVRGATYIPRARFDVLTANIASSNSLACWLPIWSKTPIRTMESSIEVPSRRFSVLSWKFDGRSFQIEAGEAQEARLRTFYYPHWIASSNGKQLSTRPDDDGALLISVPGNSVKVDLEFREPVRASIAAVISLAAWILIGCLGLQHLLPEFSRRIRARQLFAAESPRGVPE